MPDFWRHARFYFFLFAVLGLVSPYLGWWLSNSVPSGSLKIILAAFYATMIFLPALWAHAAFSGQWPGRWLSNLCLFAAIFAIGLTQVSHGLPVLAACFLVMAFGIFFNALTPLLESIAYAQLRDAAAYSRVRLFGSLGFMVCSILIGGVVVMDHPDTFPAAVVLAMVLAWFFSLPYKRKPSLPGIVVPATEDDPADIHPDHRPLEPGVLRGHMLRLWALWLVAGFSQAAFACYFTFFAMKMRAIGVPGWGVGVLIGLSTAAEVWAFLKMDFFLTRFSPRCLIAVASGVSAARWLAIALISSPLAWPVLALVQASQALGFSVFHTACIKVINDTVPLRAFGAANGFHEAVGYGVGGILGVVLSGLLWERGLQAEVFYLAMGLAVASTVAAFWLPAMDKPSPGAAATPH